MKFSTFEDPSLFKEIAGDFLLSNEVVNNLGLGILYSLVRNSTTYSNPFLAVVSDDASPVLVMIMTPPHNLFIYGEGTKTSEAISLAISHIKELEIDVPGVLGPVALANEFAQAWANMFGSTLTVAMEQRIYELQKVNPVPINNGKLRTATVDDMDLVADWIYEFAQVTPESITREGAQKLAERSINDSILYIWDDNGPVSMAKEARPTENGVVVNLVYTPPEHQRKGYATSCVAMLSQQLLDRGYKFCSLYTDLANPTSNSIYMKIGYKPVADSVVISFK